MTLAHIGRHRQAGDGLELFLYRVRVRAPSPGPILLRYCHTGLVLHADPDPGLAPGADHMAGHLQVASSNRLLVGDLFVALYLGHPCL